MRAHRKGVVAAQVNGELGFKIFKGIELVCGVEVFVVFSMRTFHLPEMVARDTPNLRIAERTEFLKEKSTTD